jgi:hypothetical protein
VVALPSIERALAILTSPAETFTLMAALVWAPATGFPTWPALARGRFGSSLVITVAVGFSVFVFCRALGAARAG